MRIVRSVVTTSLVLVALFGCSSLAHAAGLNDDACKPAAAHPYPVVLVHGRGGDVLGFGALVDALSGAGYCVFGENYGQVGGSGPNGLDHLTVSAAEIAAFVQHVRAVTGAARVDVIGHSAGTGVLDNFILARGGASQVYRLVSFGGLHHPYAHVGASGFVDSELFLPNLILAARRVDPNVTAQQIITNALALYAGAGGSLAGVDVTTATSNFASDLFDPDYWKALQGGLSEPPATFLRVSSGDRTWRTADAAPTVCYTNIVGIADVLAGSSAGFQDPAPNVDNFLLWSASDHAQILADPIAIDKTLRALATPCASAPATVAEGDGTSPPGVSDGAAAARGGCACAVSGSPPPGVDGAFVAALAALSWFVRRRRQRR